MSAVLDPPVSAEVEPSVACVPVLPVPPPDDDVPASGLHASTPSESNNILARTSTTLILAQWPGNDTPK